MRRRPRPFPGQTDPAVRHARPAHPNQRFHSENQRQGPPARTGHWLSVGALVAMFPKDHPPAPGIGCGGRISCHPPKGPPARHALTCAIHCWPAPHTLTGKCTPLPRALTRQRTCVPPAGSACPVRSPVSGHASRPQDRLAPWAHPSVGLRPAGLACRSARWLPRLPPLAPPACPHAPPRLSGTKRGPDAHSHHQ